MINVIKSIPPICSPLPHTPLIQNRIVEHIDWNIVTEIPVISCQSESLMLSGIISGISNQALIVAGGTWLQYRESKRGGVKYYCDHIVIYPNPICNSQLKRDCFSYRLPFGLAYAASCSTPEGLVVAGGENEKGASRKVLLLKWKIKESILGIEYLPDLPFSISNASLARVGNILYFAGGELSSGTSNVFLGLDLTQPTLGWKFLLSLPASLSDSVLLGSDNTRKIYLIGGEKKKSKKLSEVSLLFFAFDIKSGTWNRMPSPTFSLSEAFGVIEGDEILVFGENKGTTYSDSKKMILAIAKETIEMQNELLKEKIVDTSSLHFPTSRKILKYNLFDNQWKLLDNQIPDDNVVANATIHQNTIYISGSQIIDRMKVPVVLRGKIRYKI